MSDGYLRPDPDAVEWRRAAGQADIDTTRPQSARRYDYWLGGKDNFAADRESGDAIEKEFPSIVTAVRANRAFLVRAVTHVAQQGIGRRVGHRARCHVFLDPFPGGPPSE